jgi:tetratricopeptide (TPR) repeat protein
VFACIPRVIAAGEPALITEARQAISERIPEAAIVKLQEAMSGKTLDGDDREKAAVLLAQAQLDAGRANEALETVLNLKEPALPGVRRLHALVFASLGRWSEALAIFHALGAGKETDPAAMFGEAESLQALGRTAEAVAVLERLTASAHAPPGATLRLATLLVELGKVTEARAILRGNPPADGTAGLWQRYIEARIDLMENKPGEALNVLAPLIVESEHPRPAGLTQSLFAAAKLAETEARLAITGPDGAESTLEAFLRQNPTSPYLDIMFRRLDQVYAMEQNPDENALLRLAEELPPRGQALARFYVCRLQLRGRRFDRATSSLQDFLVRFPNHTLTPYVHAMLADAALARGDLPGAEAALDAASRGAKTDALRGEFALRTALVNLAQGEFVRASTGFRNAALQSPSLRQNATYDAALAWLRQKNYERFAEEYQASFAAAPDRLLAGNLRLEEGLVRARSADPDATRVLGSFLKEFPGHPRRAEAQLAFAELALKDGEIAEAERLADAVNASTASPEMAEQSEYLAVFIEDAKAPRDEERVISGARAFINNHPSSPLLGDVRMKLGEVYFRREDYLKAQEQFETLAREQPDAPLAAPALFLAGQASMKLLNAEALKRALELFGAVADKHGPLEQQARLQQAIIKNKLGAPDEAVRIYDSILSSQQPLEPELRLAALTGKGDNLVALGKTEPKQLSAAIASYEEVAAVADASPAWKNQAAYKKAKVLQQLKKQDEALTVLYDIITKAAAAPRETFWFSKAGFDAAGIAESRQQWKSAVAIYDKMAAVPGPHAEQARRRAKTIRLEHFLWD